MGGTGLGNCECPVFARLKFGLVSHFLEAPGQQRDSVNCPKIGKLNELRQRIKWHKEWLHFGSSKSAPDGGCNRVRTIMRMTHTNDSLHATEFAVKHPGWHTYAKDKRTEQAIERAKFLGKVETNEFRQFQSIEVGPVNLAQSQFAGICGEYLIDAGVAMENENVVKAVRAGDIPALREVLRTEF